MECSPRLFIVVIILSATAIIYVLSQVSYRENLHEYKLWIGRVKPARPYNLNSTWSSSRNITLPKRDLYTSSTTSQTSSTTSLTRQATTSSTQQSTSSTQPTTSSTRTSTQRATSSSTQRATTSSTTSSTQRATTSSTQPTTSSTTTQRSTKSSTPPTTSQTITSSTTRPRVRRPTLVPIPLCGDQSDLIDLSTVTPPGRPKIDLFINILTAGLRFDRRQAMRQTWISTAKHYSIVYRFFTDGIGIDPGMMAKLKKEQDEYKDIEFLPTKQGYWFTHRFLYAMFWGYERYDFSFYLRLDDDYFVCLNNLMNDLQQRKHEKLLYWGWLHCNPKIVNIDEGFLITSIDLVQEIIKRNHSLCCHPMGDQMVAMWVNGLDHEGYDVTYFPDNARLMHFRKHLKSGDRDMCKRILGVHEAYPEQMHRYWSNTKDNWFSVEQNDFVKVDIKGYSSYCKWPKGWDWRRLSTFWRHEPKACWKPGVRWPELEHLKLHKGREKRDTYTETKYGI